MSTDNSLLIERDHELVTITMNRPPANALNSQLIALLLKTIKRFAEDEHPPGIVLTGSGVRFFSAGGDIKEVAGIEIARPRIRLFHELLVMMERYPGPIVCAVRGYAVGGALEFLLHADYVVVDDACKIGFPEINHGLLPVTKGMRRAAEKLGVRAAQELLYWGDLVDATRAKAIGAVNEVVRTEEVEPRATKVCRTLRQKDRKLFDAIKRSLNLTAQMDDRALEDMTVADLGAYVTAESSADARARFLSKSNKG
ncbi:Enoyl-CoA hydratase/carnithine racemase [Tardiphaga sp. OK246]|jgi:enoyl-CoA hydratase/carnithine racemase|uniref:enoyl-CoA hydratase/isomerase family protein n=1 Tax=Tardiphaga sp. OK246 TaxID=1855307 RepID=UPI000B72C796|nr:enoyl-CoA hydratase/isomerase family protein [Tardiphaga sp. OK246]SNT53437.1 Enoyl-CoA hydratase/carnithine racemase [Tardiphaga sp. OK246]